MSARGDAIGHGLWRRGAPGLRRLAAAAALLGAAATGARAQSNDATASFITPFPEKDSYRVMVFGDSLADGLVHGLNEAFEADDKLEIVKKTRINTSLVRSEPDWANLIKDLIGKERPHIAIILFGARERQPFVNVRNLDPERRPPNWHKWHADLSKRVDLMVKALRKENAAIYWIGAPILKNEAASEDLQLINTVIREKVYLNGGKFIDTWNGFTDQNGQYSQFGPDLSGRVRQLREGDGIHLTAAGNRKLAHFVEREIRRDLAHAKSERNIPLAGSEAEQRRVNPTRQKLALATTQAVPPPTAPRATPAKPETKTPPREAEPTSADQKAENSRVTFTLPAEDGKKPEQVTIEIVRPSIPAQVIAHVTRRKETTKVQQIGETVAITSPTGLTVLSSVSTAPPVTTGVTRRTTTSTDALHYRVMVKGEKQPAKRGRADDFGWPRTDQSPPG